MKRKPELTPDDIEDLKAFASAVCRKLPEERVKTLVENFVICSLSMANMIDEAKDTSNFTTEERSRSIGLASLVQLYKFLKKNEYACKALFVLGPEGEPFLYDSTRD